MIFKDIHLRLAQRYRLGGTGIPLGPIPATHPIGIAPMVLPALRTVQILQVEVPLHLHLGKEVRAPFAIGVTLRGKHIHRTGSVEVQDARIGSTLRLNDAFEAVALVADVAVGGKPGDRGQPRADAHQQPDLRPRRAGPSARPFDDTTVPE